MWTSSYREKMRYLGLRIIVEFQGSFLVQTRNIGICVISHVDLVGGLAGWLSCMATGLV